MQIDETRLTERLDKIETMLKDMDKRLKLLLADVKNLIVEKRDQWQG